jgi:flavodoxin/ferredoxin
MKNLKAIIVYYSATGNTRKIARSIQAGVKRVLGDCDIASVKEAKTIDFNKYDMIGLGAPIWRRREPENVQIFIRNLPALNGKFIFPFCTHGVGPSTFMYRVTRALTGKGATYIGYKNWYGGVNQLACMPKPYPTDGHPDDIDLKEAEYFGKEMANLGQRISMGETQLIPSIPVWNEGIDPLWKPDSVKKGPLYHQVVALDRQVKAERKIDLKKCKQPACTLCVENCPMETIDFSVTQIFKKQCIVCHLCESVCPEGAIEYDHEPYYTIHVDHGFYDFKDLREQASKGRFRPLVPWDKIGTDGPGYKNDRHPRFIIPG